MTNPPYGTAPGGQWPPAGSPFTSPAAGPVSSQKQSRGPVIVSLIVAVLAIAVAIGAWFRTAHSDVTTQSTTAPQQFTTQQTSDANKALCDSYHKMFRSVNGAGGQTSDDPVLQQVYAINIRLATHVASDFMYDKLRENPAGSPQLASDLRDLANAYNEVLMAQLADAPKTELDPLYSNIDSADAKLVEACK
ncbi:hypothetical protein [Mycolicibacterium komossense]|uniref:Alanine and proline rich membrane protein n=1 Tax=Mycolicibacterium komossense TaxID=1779 RepID=A0ABT3CFU5_9MYCO|nr:hypothetical protein [Mycolicibacterium komossense]MCV7228289.1 hypothetical protein [Mycolicibacterium komossense]